MRPPHRRLTDVRAETLVNPEFLLATVSGAGPAESEAALLRRSALADAHSRRERTISEVAGAQHRVISTQQLMDLGFDRAAIGQRTKGGRLHRIHRGVYAVGTCRLDRCGWWTAGVLAAGPGAVLSHQSAAGLQNLRPGLGQVHVSVTGTGGRRNREGLIIHSTRHLHSDDVTVVDRIPVTTVARTLLDLAAAVPADHLARALVRAEVNRTLDVRAIEVAIARAPAHRGTKRLRAALAGHDRDAHRTESELQRCLLVLAVAHGLPRPELEVQLTDRDRVDFLWRAERLVVETDGFRAHGTHTAFRRDRARDRRLHALGYTVLRYTYQDVIDTPEAVAAELLSFLTGSGTMLSTS